MSVAAAVKTEASNYDVLSLGGRRLSKLSTHLSRY